MSDNIKVPCSHATFVKCEEFWCNCCDMNKVHSDKPETGKFFSQHGHTWDIAKQKTTEDYVMILFALCPDCIQKQ
jgi:hypothetical protein